MKRTKYSGPALHSIYDRKPIHGKALTMIARQWHGRVPTSKADDYLGYLQRTGLADYESTPGNRGVLVFRRDDGEATHFLITTLWDSIDAIRRFAGDDYTVARYYAEDDEYLLEREPYVTHFEVLGAKMQ
jgi:heme-degrading monooxygenase HmoA